MALPRRFVGKVAIVTASTQGIGFGIARRLGLEGASVVVSSRKQKNVDEAVAALKSQGIDVIGVVCHVSNEKQRNNLIQQTVSAPTVYEVSVESPRGIKKFGHIDVLVSNAAANPSTEAILNMPESILDKLWEVNVKASILFLQAAQPYLSKGSSVILISSISAFHPPPSMSMYGVTKAALLALAKALSSELAPDTRINCLAPGFVPTHFAGFITENDAVRKEIEGKCPLGRLGTTEDMAAATAFLASDDASYITGETLVGAGGNAFQTVVYFKFLTVGALMYFIR